MSHSSMGHYNLRRVSADQNDFSWRNCLRRQLFICDLRQFMTARNQKIGQVYLLMNTLSLVLFKGPRSNDQK